MAKTANSETDRIISILNGLKKGAKLVYHTGFLARDTAKSPSLRLIAKQALALSDAHKVHLTQRRLEFGVFQYIATGAA